MAVNGQTASRIIAVRMGFMASLRLSTPPTPSTVHNPE
jgi:hypothetical protein